MIERRILVVEDHEVLRMSYMRILERGGYAVYAAASAEEALEIYPLNPCHVLFMDIELPGMNGIELCRIMRRQWPMIIPFAVTGLPSVYQLTACRNAGFEDYFTKPLATSDMHRAAALAFEKLERWANW
jgi:CheY-like chemotaxis protein